MAMSTPVRHQTRTAPLIRGRGDLRWASISDLSSNGRIDYNAVALNQSWGSYLVVPRRKTFGWVRHSPA
jgi:hypothetical protein